ncbi:MAG TPA: STAS domain-containing protein [Bacillales bacterium]|nr:STAS domain-containing protein [Bacillales bacterium]
MDEAIINLFKDKKEQMRHDWIEDIGAVREDFNLQHINDEVYSATNERLFDLISESIEKIDYFTIEPFKKLIDRLLEIGVPLNYLTKGLQVFRRQLIKSGKESLQQPKDIHDFYEQLDKWYDPFVNKLISVSVQTWEDTVISQRTALKELSAPLIPVFEKISVMPLIGTIDTERAKLIMENLLEGVIQHRSQVVLIDITGVPVVDTMVAHHIIQAAEAVRLVGAKCILVGIRPEIAQTIVNLGIDLSGFPTKSTLMKGMQTALEMTEREIIELHQEGSR